MPEYSVKAVKYSCDRCRVVMLPEKCKHKFRFDKVDRKKDLASLFSFYTVKLGDGYVWVLLEIILKVNIFTSDPTGFINLKSHFFYTLVESNFSGEIDILGSYKSGIYKSVDSAFTYHKGIFVGHAYMMGRLLLFYQWRDKSIKIPDLILVIRNP